MTGAIWDGELEQWVLTFAPTIDHLAEGADDPARWSLHVPNVGPVQPEEDIGWSAGKLLLVGSTLVWADSVTYTPESPDILDVLGHPLDSFGSAIPYP